MKISVITVAYNAAETIAGTLDSVAAQVHDQIEHIVVDGASTDGTMAIVNAFRERLGLVISEPDRGLYDAINKGISKATGDVIAILNADDVYAHPRVLENVSEYMQHRDVDALLGDVEFFRPENPQQAVRRYRSSQFSPARIARGWMPAHPAMFLRKQVYDRFGLYKIDYRIAADFEYVARIFSGQTVTYLHIPEVMVRMRMGGVSTSGFRNTILLNQEVLRACRENNIETNMLKILSKYPEKLRELIFR